MEKLTASQARTQAQRFYFGEFSHAIKQIKEAATKGEFECFVDAGLSPHTINELKKLEYTIETNSNIGIQRDGWVHKIKW